MLQAELKVLGGKFQGKAIPLSTKRFLVGREQDCHLRPNSDSVSRHHCVFVLDDYAVRLRDLGSTNGTRVNGELIRHETVLKDGDQIQIGKLQLAMTIREVAVVATPAPAVSVPAAPANNATESLSSEFEVTSTQSGAETMFEMPAMPAEAPGGAFSSDTTILGGAGTPPAYAAPPPYNAPPAGYPAMPPAGYPGLAGQPGYPMPPQGYPPGYGMPMQQPVYPGYPPQGYGMPPGYPPGYGMPMQQPAYPQGYGAPAAPVPAPAPEPAERDEAAIAAAIPIKLPPPESTGAKAPAPPPPKVETAEGAAPAKTEEKPSQSAADIIKQYMQRRTTR